MELADQAEQHNLRLRNLSLEDYAELRTLMDLVYRDLGGAWKQAIVEQLVARFPEGQFCIEDNGRIVGCALTVRVDHKRFSAPHRYADVIDEAGLVHDDPAGDALYGLDVFVHPEYRDFRLGRRLYDARKELCWEQNLRGILAGGRIVGYAEHAERMTAAEYIEQVRRKELRDPILTFQLANDFDVKRIMRGYIPEDEKSCGYATLLEWDNLYYEPVETPLVEASKKQVRVGVVQWQMRPVQTMDELLSQAEFFVDSLSDYKSDFVLFPEFFSAPLMGIGPKDRPPTEAIRDLAALTPAVVEAMSRFAVTYNTNIVAGSMPVLQDDGTLLNVAFVCERGGAVHEQQKLHVTPDEADYWMLEGGHGLATIETDAGRIGVLICYDVEFPELPRLLADEGMDMLFVPFWTDTKNGFLRVQRCAQARAIENECYVVISGSVGNLPQVDNLDLQYAQSAVYSPSDFAFPHDAIIAETTPNTEQLLLVDLDLTKLEELHNEGSVRNLRDRRLDIFELRRKEASEEQA
ncbi:MAG: bifunctional GNAT family N-acetyltransferase/carbon-nitrogen hydrolase family protein [Pseudomonadales bacterium]|nr:bifunctional GNAT family N-acetyltransferase/carbon-nitrogen hydrolase family protein [Pseudomonadales bacterium]